MTAITVRVAGGMKRVSYPVLVGRGVWNRVGPMVSRATRNRLVFACTSAPVRRLYGRALEGACRSSRLRIHWLMVPDGERAKTIRVMEGVLRAMARAGAGRDSCMLALGGGTVGDLAGFSASVYARGIPVIQVPTTLLAQVDASIGGKTGVDLPEGKNLAGYFHQPLAVLADPGVLGTLPERQFRSGLAEVVKYGVIRSPKLFSFLEGNSGRILRRESGVVERIVAECVRIKAQVVSRDPLESALRMILNFGHTGGHAVETASGYRMLHGEAVAVGMVAAARLSVRKGLCGSGVAVRLETLLRKFGLPVRPPSGLSGSGMRSVLLRDKKTRNARLRFVLTRRIGGVTVSDSVRPDEILGLLAGKGKVV